MKPPASPMPLPDAGTIPDVPARLADAIKKALPGALVQIRDDSHRHAGHAGVRERGGGHYHATIDWAGFDDMTRLARHRLVLAAVQPWQEQGLIHAFSMTLTSNGRQN